MEKQNRIRAYKGDPVNPGVSRKTAGINFAVEIPCGISASLVLYRKGAALPEVEIPFTEEHRTGRMCAILISGLNQINMNIISGRPEKSCRTLLPG